MKITVIGIGYVGLANAILLAQNNEVAAIDIIQEKVDMINHRQSPIIDKDIQKYLKEANLNLYATTDYELGLCNAEYAIIATPTNYDAESNFFDTSSVENAIEKVIRYAPDALILIRSTIPIGYVLSIREKYGIDNVIFVPEFLREGKALYDSLYPSRIIVGECSDRAEVFADLLKGGAVKEDIPTLYVSPSEAEAIKLFANTYLALRIAFFNELDSYAEIKSLNSKQIIEGVCLDPRIGNYYNNPSFGYGGYCLPKDTKQLLANYDNVPQNIISAIVEANRTRKKFIADIIASANPSTVGIYRLTMKMDSDNFRQSAILDIMEQMKARGIDIVIYEPTIKAEQFANTKVIHDLDMFKQVADIIMANRITEEIVDVKEKVYSRDIYARD